MFHKSACCEDCLATITRAQRGEIFSLWLAIFAFFGLAILFKATEETPDRPKPQPNAPHVGGQPWPNGLRPKLGHRPQPGQNAGLTSETLVQAGAALLAGILVCSVGAIFVFGKKRKDLLLTEDFEPTLAVIHADHKTQFGIPPKRVVPVAK